MRKILVTSGLPYANGPLHLGHLVEYLQTDIWARFQRLIGNDCIYVCGDDAHGTPIMLSAEQKGITPEQLIAEMQLSHEEDFAKFHIHFDSYHTTHSQENKELVELIYQRLCKHEDIVKRTIKQAYDPEKNMFLPDRYVRGECPRCGAEDQYGDSCEVCSATYSPLDLINPKSAVSGVAPIEKESEHYFFRLDKYEQILREWASTEHLQSEVVNKLNEWFEMGLKQWDISRDEPYFGFSIPNAPGKYFYVWLDAPIGYMAGFKKLCDSRKDLNFDEYWKAGHDTELYHFIGKDIMYFHALFWPAILTSSEFRKPDAVFAHGFLTVNGKKMSKSRGTFILARDYLQYLDPEYLRYYFAAKLTNRVDDVDLDFADFMQRVNSDLVGKVINIASRCAGFITKKFSGKLAAELSEPILFEDFVAAGDEIAKLYENREYSHAMRVIMALADRANQYIAEHQPWVLAKQEGQEQNVQNVCTMGINLFRVLMTYLQPVLPNMASRVAAFLNLDALTWDERKQPLQQINIFKPLMQLVEQDKIDLLINTSKK